MKKIIHKLRERPEKERIHILNFLIIILIIIFASLWVLSLNKNFININNKKKIEEELKPFSILKNSLKSDFNFSN